MENATSLAPTFGSNTPRSSTDRLINAKELKYRVVFSLQHIYRLEELGQFPPRIQLGKARVGWSATDIVAWMQAKIDARGVCPFNPQADLRIRPSDRFIVSDAARPLWIGLTASHLRERGHHF